MMVGTIIENMSGWKLAMFSAGMVICQILSFLAGAMYPAQSNTEHLLATKCYDPDGDPNNWFYPRGKRGCRTIEDISKTAESIELGADNVVFTFHMPLPSDGTQLAYSRWQQNLIGALRTDITYKDEDEKDMTVTLPTVTVAIKIDARLGYRNKGDAEGDWKEYTRSSEVWNLDCNKHFAGDHYNCSTLPLFDLGSLHNAFYLLNIRLNLDNNMARIIEEEEIGKRVDLWLLVTNQIGGFTQMFVAMKTFFFLIIVLEMIWFWRRVTQLTRPLNHLEIRLLVLGAALTLLNLPLKYLTLAFNMPWFSIMDDIRQGLFYADLFLFWITFARHISGKEEIKSSPKKRNWKIFTVMSIVCLFLGPICQRAALLHNPFQPLYNHHTLNLVFVDFASIPTYLYFLFLCVMVKRAFTTTSHMTPGTVWRFRILMMFTLLTAITIIGSEAFEDLCTTLGYPGAFNTGIYSLWNIYIASLLFFFAPSHKQGIYDVIT